MRKVSKSDAAIEKGVFDSVLNGAFLVIIVGSYFSRGLWF